MAILAKHLKVGVIVIGISVAFALSISMMNAKLFFPPPQRFIICHATELATVGA